MLVKGAGCSMLKQYSEELQNDKDTITTNKPAKYPSWADSSIRCLLDKPNETSPPSLLINQSVQNIQFPCCEL